MSESVITIISVFVLCYLTGSIPTAYLVVKKRLNKDITKEGSGNVGTLNAMLVTKSKGAGIFVLAVDFMKGFLPMVLMLYVLHIDYTVAACGSCFIVAGHNYPFWLKFKGGRGLAPAAGVFLALNFYVLAGWCITWAVSKVLKLDVLAANSIATFSIFIYLIVINKFDIFVINYNFAGFSLRSFTIYSIIVVLVVLTKHTEVLSKFINKKN